jgi:ribonuclease P protein component
MNGHICAGRDHDQTDHAEAAAPRTVKAAAFARLKKRSEFLAVAKGARMHEAAFTLQAQSDPERGEPPARRFGLTVTKKTGNSVERNRMRRRLREALRLSGAAQADALAGGPRDYVVVARREVLARAFHLLKDDLVRTLERIDRRLAGGKSRAGGPDSRTSVTKTK